MENALKKEEVSESKEVTLMTISTKAFQDALKRVSKVVESRHTMPILSMALLTVNKSGAFLQVTDLEISKEVPVIGKIARYGAVMIPLRQTEKILKSVKLNAVTIGIDSDGAFQIDASGSFKLKSLPSDEFPMLPAFADSFITGTIPAHELLNDLAKVVIAISKEESRVNLTGACFDGKKIVATDGHRLHSFELSESLTSEKPVIIPAKGIKELITSLKKAKGDVKIYQDSLSAKNLFFRVDEDLIIIRCIDEVFPDYSRVIPKENKSVFTLSTKSLVDKIKQAALMSTEKYKGIRFDFSEVGVIIEATNNELGTFTGDIDVIDQAGEGVYIGLNAQYIIDFCNVLPKDSTVTFTLKDEFTQALLTSIDAPGYTGVIMPMRL